MSFGGSGIKYFLRLLLFIPTCCVSLGTHEQDILGNLLLYVISFICVYLGFLLNIREQN
jgi:hypothetical protein